MKNLIALIIISCFITTITCSSCGTKSVINDDQIKKTKEEAKDAYEELEKEKYKE